jgi:hypothetical protein
LAFRFLKDSNHVPAVAQKTMPSFKAGKEMHARQLNTTSADQVANEANSTSELQ